MSIPPLNCSTWKKKIMCALLNFRVHNFTILVLLHSDVTMSTKTSGDGWVGCKHCILEKGYFLSNPLHSINRKYVTHKPPPWSPYPVLPYCMGYMAKSDVLFIKNQTDYNFIQTCMTQKYSPCSVMVMKNSIYTEKRFTLWKNFIWRISFMHIFSCKWQ